MSTEESDESDEMTEHVSVLTPIGHAGMPLPHDYFEEADYQRPKSATPEVISIDFHETADVMSNLPFEVKIQITKSLTQYDLVNLARTSKSFYVAAVQALFAKIVVDSRHSYLQSSDQRESRSATYIKTRYNFTKLMRLVAKEGQSLGKLIKCLEVVHLPDGMNQSETRSLICNSLPLMSGLCKFYCDSDALSMPLNILKLLPNKQDVESLAVNIDLRQGCETIGAFENVRKLSISPFVSSEKLATFLNNILVPSVVQNLSTLRMARECASVINKSSRQSLIVTKYMLNNNLEEPNVGETDEAIRYNQMDLDFWKFLDPIVDRNFKLLSLRNLEIAAVNIVPEDSTRVVQGIDLSKLTLLALSDVQEVQLIPEVDYEVSDFTSLALEYMQPSFLCGLAPYLRNLQKLRLDFREPIKDSVHVFISQLKRDAQVSLWELDITVHWDDNKLALWPNWGVLAQKYMDSILMHAGTLRKLSLIAHQDFKFYELPKRIPGGVLLQLQRCQQLRSLRLHGDSLHPTGSELIGKLHGLEKLDLVGKAAGGPQHMALQVVHAGVLDNWYRVIHVAIALARASPNLKQVRIDRCLFACFPDGTVGPQTDNSDFDIQTRVLMSANDWE
ncbi:LANO_0H09670g1_1 [Lachancea nothofagi CBS 11611]|uniref:LANO_0H09670g1_1 n=1 Tax=Lachancea nothofagi CBS 11611 TaxID=1266666 RepID=A0A1G4KM19_9SACH|nr:LANO_0H09670g1_1 [Lachancea nothofagi CBS 11611]